MTPSLNSHRQQVEHPQVMVKGLTKSFGGGYLYNNFSVDILKGHITCIFGPNGCGKSTLLNMIAGLIQPNAGDIIFEGQDLQPIKIGYVFQNYREALFPWLRALQNIEYPLKVEGIPKIERVRRVEALIDTFGLQIDLTKYPYQLSGGQQQLVSIMRSLVTQPDILFLDEPFSAIDYETTLFLRDKLQEIFSDKTITMVMVSHDLEETVYMASRILMLTKAPTQLAEVIPFDMKHPRSVETLALPEFITVKSHCLEVFQREVRR